jgi:hypothetical protein
MIASSVSVMKATGLTSLSLQATIRIVPDVTRMAHRTDEAVIGDQPPELFAGAPSGLKR